MGYNSSIIVLHDYLEKFRTDPDFAENFVSLILQGKPYNGLKLVECHHADDYAVVVNHGNIGKLVYSFYDGSSLTEGQVLQKYFENKGVKMDTTKGLVKYLSEVRKNVSRALRKKGLSEVDAAFLKGKLDTAVNLLQVLKVLS